MKPERDERRAELTRDLSAAFRAKVLIQQTIDDLIEQIRQHDREQTAQDARSAAKRQARR